jgi:hypothetical protein
MFELALLGCKTSNLFLSLKLLYLEGLTQCILMNLWEFLMEGKLSLTCLALELLDLALRFPFVEFTKVSKGMHQMFVYFVSEAFL